MSRFDDWNVKTVKVLKKGGKKWTPPKSSASAGTTTQRGDWK